VAGVQTPIAHASSKAEQFTAVPLRHVRVFRSHVSVPLHALRSEQSASVVQAHPLASATHPAAASEHRSTVQAIPSLQLTAAP
jgi:hypothetical protein